MSEPQTLRALAAKWREPERGSVLASRLKCAAELDALADALEARCTCPEHMWKGDEMSESLCKLSEEEHFLLFALIGLKVQP